jgi:hypothetical protein
MQELGAVGASSRADVTAEDIDVNGESDAEFSSCPTYDATAMAATSL